MDPVPSTADHETDTDTPMADAEPAFEPRIIGFVCRWCTSNAADLAGTTRIQYPPNLTLIRLMCSASIDPVYVVRALLEGADGVLVGGCHPGDCHYVSGNYKARRRMALLRNIITTLGLDQDRLRFEWIGADEGRKFAQTVTEMTELLKSKGRSPMAGEWAL